MRIALAAVLLGCVVIAQPVAAQMTQSEVEEALTCQCGCGLTVHSCNHTTCSFAIPVRNEIADALAAGTPGEEIIASYVDKYGEKILSSPTPEGFNLLAWFMPYAALIVGGILIVVVIRRWQRPSEAAGTEPPGSSRQLSKEQRDAIDKALEEL